ncbi:MAG: hypothetical protein PV344_02755, partial [Anaplasma sp.]|nr:hypothetical protein [Anaplasma sp.]
FAGAFFNSLLMQINLVPSIRKTRRTLKLRLEEWNAIALSGPVCIAFSFASHALESHNDLKKKCHAS